MTTPKKIIFAGVSVGALAVLFLALAVYPIVQGVRADREKVFAYRQELRQLEEDKKHVREFEALSRQYAEELARLQSIFVDNRTPVAFFRFLDETAAALDLEMEKVPGSVQHAPGDRWPSFKLHLGGRGGYPDFAVFLQKLESAPYLLQVETLSLSKKTDAQLGKTIEFSLSLKVFTR